MDYQKHYTRLIERAQDRILPDYSEKHHILPRCLGGSNSKSNIVKLTPEEHYVAHQLLSKIHPENHSLKKAAWMMTVRSANQQRNNKAYGWIKRNARPMGITNGMFGKTHSDEIKTKLAELAKHRFSGKTYEELYGKEKSDKLKFQRSIKAKELRAKHPTVGKLNPNAKSYKFTNPEGNEFYVSGNLKEFCKTNSLWIEKIIDVAKGRIPEYRGWKIIYV